MDVSQCEFSSCSNCPVFVFPVEYLNHCHHLLYSARMPHYGLEKPFWKLLVERLLFYNLQSNRNFHSVVAAFFFATFQKLMWPGNLVTVWMGESLFPQESLKFWKVLDWWIPVLLEMRCLLLFLKVEVYWYLWTDQAWCESTRKWWKDKSLSGSVPLKSVSDDWQMWNEKTVSKKYCEGQRA